MTLNSIKKGRIKKRNKTFKVNKNILVSKPTMIENLYEDEQAAAPCDPDLCISAEKKKKWTRKNERKIVYDWRDPNEVSRLISIVEKRRALWDHATVHYKSRNKQSAWEEVAEEFGNGINWNDAKVKWSNLRVTFQINLSKLRSKKSGQAANESNKVMWKHFNEMMFLESAKLEQSTESTSSLSLVNIESAIIFSL